MTESEFLSAFSKLLNEAARTNTAATLIDSLTNALASTMAIATLQTETDPDVVIETVRHQLDIAYTGWMKSYRNASRTTS